jgi:hypothetical protein
MRLFGKKKTVEVTVDTIVAPLMKMVEELSEYDARKLGEAKTFEELAAAARAESQRALRIYQALYDIVGK